MRAQVKPLGGSGVKNKQVAQTNLTGNFSGGRTVAGGGRESNQFSMGKLLGGVAVKGADEFVSGLTSTAAWLESATLGKLFPGTTEYSPIQGINERVQQAKVHNREYTAPNVKAGGKAAEIVDKYGTAVVAAVPQAGLAAMSGGTSAAAQGTTASLQAASSAAQAGTRFLPTVNSAFSSMAKDPQYWISFSQTAGNNYEQAKADGASDAKASLYALGNGLMTAAVEVGGGIQKLPGELQKGTKWFRAWTDTMLDEGKEEVVQGVLERGLQNLIYRKDNPLFSAKDESAILNPRTGVEDFLGGTIVGGILGGGQVSVNSAGNAVQGAAQGQNKTAPVSTGAEYRAERPQNVEYPTVPIINLSMQDVADLNGGVMPQTGNYVRKAATEQTEKRLGLDKNPAIYIEASNVTRNGDSYVIKITKPSLKKMLSASSYASGVVPLESVAVLNQIERIAQNGVYFKSEGDRYGRSQIAGYDHLMTTVYIDDIPFVVDMRVRVSDQKTDNGNTLYHFTPEAIEITKKNDSDISTTGRHAPSIKSETPLSSDTTVPQAAPGVKNEYTPELGVQTGAAAKPTLAQQIDSMRRQLMDMQHRKKLDELAAVYEKNVPAVNKLDAQDLAEYDGHKEADLYGRREEATSSAQRNDGVNVWRQNRRSDTGGIGEYQKMDGGIPQAQSGETGAADWARGHIVERPVNTASAAAENQAKDYYPDVYVVKDSALKARRPNAWATTSKGIIYLSDSIPEDLADVVGRHEVVHAAKQRNDKAYVEFLDDVGDRINYQSEQSDMVLTIILKANSQGRSMFDLNLEGQKRVFDELNAVIWGYYKADPDNARAQFAGMFKDYDSYIAELDAIMENFKISNWGQWND